jgi:hypothetical protein
LTWKHKGRYIYQAGMPSLGDTAATSCSSAASAAVQTPICHPQICAHQASVRHNPVISQTDTIHDAAVSSDVYKLASTVYAVYAGIALANSPRMCFEVLTLHRKKWLQQHNVSSMWPKRCQAMSPHKYKDTLEMRGHRQVRSDRISS